MRTPIYVITGFALFVLCAVTTAWYWNRTPVRSRIIMLSGLLALIVGILVSLARGYQPAYSTGNRALLFVSAVMIAAGGLACVSALVSLTTSPEPRETHGDPAAAHRRLVMAYQAVPVVMGFVMGALASAVPALFLLVLALCAPNWVEGAIGSILPWLVHLMIAPASVVAGISATCLRQRYLHEDRRGVSFEAYAVLVGLTYFGMVTIALWSWVLLLPMLLLADVVAVALGARFAKRLAGCFGCTQPRL